MLPHEFEMLWRLSIEGPLTAGELAAEMNRGEPDYRQQTPRVVGTKLRSHVKRGFLVRDDGIYRLTDEGRAYVDA